MAKSYGALQAKLYLSYRYI